MSSKFAAISLAVLSFSCALTVVGCSEPEDVEISPSDSLAAHTDSATDDPAASGTSSALESRSTSPAVSSQSGTATQTPAATETIPAQAGQASAFIVDGAAKYSKYHHNYPAADVFAACGSPALAPATGTVSYTNPTDEWDATTNRGPDRGGISLAIDSGDVRYYMSHLQTLTVSEGQLVSAGEAVGTVGETGSAAGTGCHIHFGLSSTKCQITDWWLRRGRTSPYEFLREWEDGADASPAAEVNATWEKEGCLNESEVNYKDGEHR